MPRAGLLVFSLLSVLCFVSPSKADAPIKEVNQPLIHIAESVNAKLYRAIGLMENNEKWAEVSEILREVLQEDVYNPAVVDRIRIVKQFVDREPFRKRIHKFFDRRLETLSFLEARILLLECIREMRPMLNRSWDGEVRHFQKIVWTTLFPHAEEYGDVLLPKPAKYAFSKYAYTLRNVRTLFIGKGGRKVKALFTKYLKEEKKSLYSGIDDDEDDYSGISGIDDDYADDESGDEGDIDDLLSIERLSYLRGRIAGDLLESGVKPESLDTEEEDRPASGLDDLLGDDDDDDDDDLIGDDDEFDDDDSDLGIGGFDGDDRVMALRKAYKWVNKTIRALRHKHTHDEIEALTLLFTALANPDLVNYDPQLRDFMKGVKFRFRLAEFEKDAEELMEEKPKEEALDEEEKPKKNSEADKKKKKENSREFTPAELELVRLVNDAIIPNQNIRVELEVDNKTDQRVLYLVSNLNGQTNFVANVLAFKNLIATIQFFKSVPPPILKGISATPKGISKVIDVLAHSLEQSYEHGNYVFRRIGPPIDAVFRILVATGGKSVEFVTQRAATYAKALVNQPGVAKGLNTLRSRKLLYSLVALSVASDVSAGMLELWNAPEQLDRAPIVIRTAAKSSGTLAYLSRSRTIVFPVAALDLGNMITSRIPSTPDLLEWTYQFGYRQLYSFVFGQGPEEELFQEIKTQLQFTPNEASILLREYETAIQNAKELKDLTAAESQLSSRLGLYASRRLVFHYVSVNSLDGGESNTLGHELREQSLELDRIHWPWFNPPGKTDAPQAGLARLDRKFWQKWVKFGGEPRRLPQTLEKALERKKEQNSLEDLIDDDLDDLDDEEDEEEDEL
ncbi:MAG: hypothetical protein AB1540_12370 [Bdellovibrionota bacterium]